MSSANTRTYTNEDVRQSFNPFGTASWAEFLNKLTEGYMRAERDEWTELAPVHHHWIDLFEADRNVGILAHRDSLKTTFTLGYVIACLEYRDGFRAHWITNNQTQAFKKADTEFWKFVERNEWLTTLNETPRERSKSTKEFANGSAIYAGWLFGGIEGDRSHLLILDDIIKERGDGATNAILTWIEGVTIPMVKDSGKTAIIGTRKRSDDIYSQFKDRAAYDFTEFPAVLEIWDQEFGDDADWADRRPPPDLYTEVENPFSQGGETVHILWPEARGPQYLYDKYEQMSPHLFWREYCMVIMGSAGNLVDAADINKLASKGGCSIRGDSPPRERQAGSGERIIIGHDPAQSPTGDDAAFTVWLFGRDGRRTLLDATAEQGMAPSQIKATLAEYDRRFDPAVIGLESNGMQQYLVNDAIEMSSSMRSKVRGYATSGKKHSWENGIPQLRNLVESGSIQFYRGHSATEDFIQAAESLELRDGRLHGHTPDYIASWYVAEQANRELEQRDVESNHGGIASF